MNHEPRTLEPAPGIKIVVRGWLHSNTVLLPGRSPALIDTGYHSGVQALMACIDEVAGFAVRDLEHIYLTHVHSDHAGGCAELTRRSGARIAAHEQCRALIDEWDVRRLWLEGMGQDLPRFRIDDVLVPGERRAIGGIEWHVVETLGHATGGISLYASRHKLLVSGDALWRDGFGVLNLHIDGEQAIELAERALDNLAALDVDVVIPGHGEPFGDYRAALARARRCLRGYRDDRARTLARNLRSMLAFWLLANPGAPRAELEAAIRGFLAAEQLLRVPGQSVEDTVTAILARLVGTGVMKQEGDCVYPGDRLA